MQKPLEFEFANQPRDDAYNLASLQHILYALDFLKSEAARSGMEDLVDILDSALKMATAAYTISCRYSLLEKLESNHVN